MKLSIALLAVLISFSSLAADEIIKTNLPATISVSISNNVVTGDNATGCNLCYDNHGHWKGGVPAVMNLAPCKPYHPATERWTITNFVRKVTIQIEWCGKWLEHSEETTLSSVTNRWKLSQEWKKD